MSERGHKLMSEGRRSGKIALFESPELVEGLSSLFSIASLTERNIIYPSGDRWRGEEFLWKQNFLNKK